MTERELQAVILEMCRWMRLITYHTYNSRRSQAGFPDLVIVGPGGFIFRELKTATGRLSEQQAKWLDALSDAGANARVWRPIDWFNGTVKAELKPLADRGGH